MDAQTLGRLGEARVKVELIKAGCEVYECPMGYWDFIAKKPDGSLETVEVKSTRCKTSSGKWEVRLETHNHNTSEPFDNTKVDILAFYVEPLDTVLFIDAKEIAARYKWSFNVPLKTLKSS